MHFVGGKKKFISGLLQEEWPSKMNEVLNF